MTDAPPKVMRMFDYAGDRAAAAQDGADSSAQVESVPMLTLDQLREQSQSTAWLVKHVVPAESLGLLYGASGTFKSFIGIDLALHIAHGLPWLGKKTRQGPVIIIAAEGGTGLWRRIVAWHKHRRIPWKGAPVYVVPISVDLGTDAILVREAAAKLGVTPSMVMIDTLSQTFRGEENSAGEVAAYLGELGLQFRACWSCAVLVVHHTGHNASERPRGTSALRSNVDFMFGVFRDDKEMLATVECHKQKDGEPFTPAVFVLKVCELAKDEDGDPITSLVASRMDDTDTVIDFMRHEAQRGRGGKNQTFLDLALNGIEEKKLRTLFYETVDGDAEAKRQAYFRARRWATTNNIVEIAKGVVIRLGE